MTNPVGQPRGGSPSRPDDLAEQLIQQAAIASCEDHYSMRHVNTIPPCAEAHGEAEWWAGVFGIQHLAKLPFELEVEIGTDRAQSFLSQLREATRA